MEAGYFFLSYRFQIWNSDHPTPLQKLLLLSHIELLYAEPNRLTLPLFYALGEYARLMCHQVWLKMRPAVIKENSCYF